MDALGSILFTLFLLLGIYVFFYEAVMALIRRVQYGDPVPVGAPPPEVVANHAREEEMIAQIGARRREQRHVGVQQRLQEEFLRWEQFNDLRHGSVGRRTGGGRPAFAPQPALSAAELERRRVVQEQDSEYQRALEADSELRRQEHLLKQEEAARLAQEAEARAREQEQMAAERLRKEQLREQRIHLFGCLPKEPEATSGDEGPDVVDIAIRFPDGCRISRRFYSSDKLADVRCFIEGARPDITENYRVVCAGITKSALGPLDATLDALGLNPRALLIVDEPDL